MSDQEEVSTDPSDYSDLEYESSSPTVDSKSTISMQSDTHPIDTKHGIKLQSVHDKTNSTKPPSLDDCKAKIATKCPKSPLQKLLKVVENDVKDPKKEEDMDMDSESESEHHSSSNIEHTTNLAKLECSTAPHSPRTSTKRHELFSESLDFLLAKTLCIHPSLRWNNEWCRYCGARASAAFGKSPWGAQQLCHKHHTMWMSDELKLSCYTEPSSVDDVINASECTEKEYLVDILMGYGEDEEMKRRSWRIQNKDIKKQYESNDDDDDDDGEDSASDDDDMDESESWHSQSEEEEESDEYAPKQQLKCRDCGKMFVSTTAYQYHCSEKHENDKPFYCTQCPKMYRAAGGLDYHVRKIHQGEINFHCKYCEKPFFNKSQLKLHQETHTRSTKTEEKKFPCPHCSRLFRMKYYLKRHVINIHMQNEDKPYQCQYCTYGAATRKQIMWHENIHRNKREFKCRQCSASFNNEVDVRKHTANKHTKPFKCDLCDKGFGTPNYLKMHMIHRHTPMRDKPYQCQHCDYGSGNKESVRKHSLTHSSSSSLKCGQCGQQFKLLRALHTHMAKLHDETKKWKCNVCQKRFKTNKYLANHAQIHVISAGHSASSKFQDRLDTLHGKHGKKSSSKPFGCDICNEQFRLKSYLQTHMKVHHGKKRKYTKKKKMQQKKKKKIIDNQQQQQQQHRMTKKPKDPNHPQRPLNSFFLFQVEVRKELKKEDRYMVSQAEVAKEIGRRWKELTQDEKQKYKEEEYRLRENYNQQLEKYRTTKQWKQYRQQLKQWQHDCKIRKQAHKQLKTTKIETQSSESSSSSAAAATANGAQQYSDDSDSFESDGSTSYSS